MPFILSVQGELNRQNQRSTTGLSATFRHFGLFELVSRPPDNHLGAGQASPPITYFIIVVLFFLQEIIFLSLAMKERKLIELDGRTGEGGGQVVRIATALAAVATQPIRITHVRGNREGPRGGGEFQDPQKLSQN